MTEKKNSNVVYMSLLTVAHQRGSGEFTGFTVKHNDGDHDEGGNDGGNFNQMQGGSSMVSGYNGDRERNEMVSALTHVASSGSNQMGNNNEWIQRSGFPLISSFGNASSSSSSFYSSGSGSSSGLFIPSGSWIGHKREREEESSDSNQFITQTVPKLFRTVMVPSQGQRESSSSSGKLLLLFSNSILSRCSKVTQHNCKIVTPYCNSERIKLVFSFISSSKFKP